MIISPSILSVKKDEYKEKINELETLGITYLHLDVMDGVFVPNTTYDSEEVNKIRSYTKMILDTHLMVENPNEKIDAFLKAGSDIITFHIEACSNPLEIIDKIHKNNKKCGISIKPKTDVSVILPFLKMVDLVLVMSVEPGFGGQKFMNSALNKIKLLNDLRITNNYHYLIEVDGGINNITIQECKKYGADISVVGTYLMNSTSLKATYEGLLK